MKKAIISIVCLCILLQENLFAKSDFIRTIDGYARVGYQTNDKHYQDLAIGGKLHVDTIERKGFSAGVSFYTSESITGLHDGAEVAFLIAKTALILFWGRLM